MTAVSGYDVLRPFAFVFEDPRWLPKVLIGGLFVLASLLLVGVFFLLGYVAKLVRNVIAGVQFPLPEWDDLGDYFGEGLLLFFVCVIYVLPILALGIGFGIPAALLSAAQNEDMRNLGGGVAGCVWCLIAPLSLAVSFFVPASLLMTITTGRFGAAFEFGRVWSLIRENIGNYLLAFVVLIVARFFAGFGIVLLCIGIIFTHFWAMVVGGYAYGQFYRLAAKR
jgi:hypothetical protein